MIWMLDTYAVACYETFIFALNEAKEGCFRRRERVEISRMSVAVQTLDFGGLQMAVKDHQAHMALQMAS